MNKKKQQTKMNVTSRINYGNNSYNYTDKGNKRTQREENHGTENLQYSE